MTSKIIKELTNLEHGIKDANNPVVNNKENKRKNREIDVATLMFFKNMIILKEFILNPLQTADIIIKVHGDLPYSKDFPELYKAINSQHTKNQGVQIGKEKIVAYIKQTAEEIKSKYKPLNDLVSEPITKIEKLIELVDTAFDYPTIIRRWQQATENEHFTNFTLTNVDKYFAPEGIEVSSTISLINFLRVCVILYPNAFITLLEEAANTLSSLNKDIMAKVAYIEVNNKYMKTKQFNKTKIVYPEVIEWSKSPACADKKEDAYKLLVQETFSKLPTENEENKKDLFYKLVTETENIRDNLVLELNKVKLAYEQLGKLELGIDSVVDTIIKTVVEPMDAMSITVDDYAEYLDSYKLVVHNLLNVYDNAIRYIELVSNVPANAYYITDRIHTLLDKVLIASSMDKGVEKQPNFIAYDNTPTPEKEVK